MHLKIPKKVKEMSPEQQAKMESAVKIMVDGLPAVAQFLLEAEAKMERDIQALRKDFTSKVEGVKALIPEIQQEIKAVELTPGPQGEPGKDAIITEKIKKDIAKFVQVPVVEKIIEKTEIIREQPIITKVVEQVAVTDSADVIKDKISLDLIIEELRQEFLTKLEEKTTTLGLRSGNPGLLTYVDTTKKGFLKGLNLKSGTGTTLTHSVVNGLDTITFASSGGGVNIEIPSGTVNGTNTTFTVSNTPKYIVVDDTIRYPEGGYYTYLGGTITCSALQPPQTYIKSFY